MLLVLSTAAVVIILVIVDKMSTSARKRLMRDFKRLQNDPPQGVQAAPLDNNVMAWQAVIFGPDDTPWEGGTFKLLLEFTEDYPNKPPVVRLLHSLPLLLSCIILILSIDLYQKYSTLMFTLMVRYV